MSELRWSGVNPARRGDDWVVRNLGLPIPSKRQDSAGCHLRVVPPHSCNGFGRGTLEGFQRN